MIEPHIVEIPGFRAEVTVDVFALHAEDRERVLALVDALSACGVKGTTSSPPAKPAPKPAKPERKGGGKRALRTGGRLECNKCGRMFKAAAGRGAHEAKCRGTQNIEASPELVEGAVDSTKPTFDKDGYWLCPIEGCGHRSKFRDEAEEHMETHG